MNTVQTTYKGEAMGAARAYYLEWTNHYLSLAVFAEHHFNGNEKLAKRMIRQGKKDHELYVGEVA
ncbi:hypothetical protein [Bacterioplanoides sp.]|uniref:hypothetical protein n=1 Tax=Bacterioplanoides sp. TaxID=2066072 RepID=UPI003B0011C0